MTTLMKRTPAFSNLSDLHHALDRMFDQSWLDREGWLSNVVGSNWTPAIDVKEEINQYLVRADVPGVDPKNLEVTIDKGVLTIKGFKETEKKEDRDHYLHLERTQGSFFRSFSLPNTTDSTNVTAKFKNGVLEISVPKNKESAAKKIQIKEE